ncbi:MAG: phytanoyl-CoA dioxygenase family protein [Caulobacterales bacterium]|nr:phytanoyl-CoA dioxygenase family protein [Caulobacterales bacterium]
MSETAPSPPRLHPRNQGFSWRETARPGRRLTEAEIAQFDADGFVKLEGVFTAAELAEVTAAIDPLEAEHEARVRAAGGGIRLSSLDAITFTTHIVTRSPVLAAFAAHPALKAICLDLIGPDVRLYWDQSVYKKSGRPQEFPWHQDNGYTFTEPQQYLTCWIPLADADEANGCPWIAPGLHRLGTLEHWPTPIGLKCLEAAPDAVCVPARAGDVIVFSSLSPHRTGPNLKAGTVRKAYILQYAPDGAIAYPAAGGAVAQNDPDRQFKILDGGR